MDNIRTDANRSRFVRWVAVVALSMLMITPTFEPLAAAQQTIPTSERLPNLWDAAGRSFLGGRHPQNKISSVSIDVGEFYGESSSVLMNSDLHQRILVRYLPEPGNTLRTDVPIELHNLNVTGIYGEAIVPSGGQTGVFAFAIASQVFVVSVTGNYTAVPNALSLLVADVIGVVQSSTLPLPTSSDQATSSGLWSLLATATSPIVTGYFQQEYLSPLFSGAIPSTPALDERASVLTIEQAASPFTPTASNLQYGPVTEPVPANTAHGTATLEVRARLTTGEYEQSFYFGCFGTGSYSYLGPESTIDVMDATGIVVASQRVSVGQYAGDPANPSSSQGQCLIIVEIQNVPLGSGYYTVADNGRTVLTTSPPLDGSPWIVDI